MSEQYELLKQIITQTQASITDLKQEVKELYKLGTIKEVVITRLEGRLKALEVWQATLIQHLENATTEKKSWVKDVALATFGALLAYLVTTLTQ